MKKYLSLLFVLSLNSFSCNYELQTNEINVWGYPVSVEKIFEYKLSKKKFSPIYDKRDVDFYVSHEQLRGRFLKSAQVIVSVYKDQKLLKELKVRKKCIMMNCSVNDFIKTIIKATKKMNKEKDFCQKTNQIQ